MAEVFAVLALACIAFMSWQLYRAKQYNRFLSWLVNEIKPALIESIKQELEDSRSETMPNNEAHLQATIYFYSHYKIRIFQGALAREIISSKWMAVPANKRMAQHLLHLEQAFKLY